MFRRFLETGLFLISGLAAYSAFGTELLLPWGCQLKEYKTSMSLIHGLENSEELEFTYRHIPRDRIPSEESLKNVWTHSPYLTSGTSTDMPDLDSDKINEFPGLKQHAPFYEDGKVFEPTVNDVRFKPLSKEKQEDINEYNSYHVMKSNISMGEHADKVGKGLKFHNYGVNSCINAIVTRYDKNGNVQMMAMQRPKNADSDAGEYQMSAGCLFFGGKGHDLDIDGEDYIINGPTGFKVTGKGNFDEESGRLIGKGKAYAVAAILEKLWANDPDSKEAIQKWDFYKLFSGLVDDTSNTRDSWVETGYVVHHILGTEDELELFENSKVNPGRINVGEGVWRSIDTKPAGEVYSQVAIEEIIDGHKAYRKLDIKHADDAKAFRPDAEFEFWHGDHSLVAARICDYVKANYEYIKPGEYGFGKSRKKNLNER